MTATADSIRTLRKYLGSQNLYTSLRLTAAALLPSVVLYHFDLLAGAIVVPLGAIFTGLTDSPGPVHHRRNGLIFSIVLNFIVIVFTGALHRVVPLVVAAIALLGVLFSLFSVYGTRAGSIGLNALLIFIFNIDGHLLATGTALHEALLFAAGGIWYASLAFVLHKLRPYKLMQQMLGECIIEIANYLETKAKFYDEGPDYTALHNELIQYQIKIRQMQEDLRELLFKTRSIVEESTTRGRVLMSVFLDSIDLMERIMTSQYDYTELHQRFANTNILGKIKHNIDVLAGELHETGLALQGGYAASKDVHLDALQEEAMDAFFELRKKHLNENTVDDFIALRQILYSLQDITERIKRLRISTCFDSKANADFKNDVDLNQFITRSDLDPRLLITNLTLQSSSFRHGVRLTAGLLAGYLVSLFFPIGHSYWILFTIAVIIKPSYSVTRKRNWQRLGGTLVGAALGFGLLYAVHNFTALFFIVIAAMVIAYSFLKVNYFISSAGITLYVLLSFDFLSTAGVHHALNDRVIDTLIGSAIAWLAAIVVLPKWEHEQIDSDLQKAIEANRGYFTTVANAFLGKPSDVTTFKLHRKNAFIALANLSDTFNRMLSEPKNRQVKLSHYHQFVASSHTLTSYIASLSYYADRLARHYASDEYSTFINQIDKQFQTAEEVLQHHQSPTVSQIQPLTPLNNRVKSLLAQRRRELAEGKKEGELTMRKTLSDLKTINDQFELISTATVDEIRILENIVA